MAERVMDRQAQGYERKLQQMLSSGSACCRSCW